MKSKKKVLSEYETRKNVLEFAESLGCKGDVIKIFNKYDALLKDCTNDQERKAIGIMGNMEIHRLISSEPGKIIIDGKAVS